MQAECENKGILNLVDHEIKLLLQGVALQRARPFISYISH